jgi:putative flippase GtrA
VKDLLLQKKQFLLYCVIGGTCTCLDFGIYTLLLKTTPLGGNAGHEHYQAANLISYTCATLCSFFLNAHFNFRLTDRLAARLASFLVVGLIGYLASAALLQVLVGHYDFNKYLSKAATLVVVVLIQYNLNRLFSFRKAS